MIRWSCARWTAFKLAYRTFLSCSTGTSLICEAHRQVTEKARHYGYAANIGKEVDPSKGLVLQYELKLTERLTCGGAYLKFLTASSEFDASGLVEDTPYVVMFGPDKCGATDKVMLKVICCDVSLVRQRSESCSTYFIVTRHCYTPKMQICSCS